MPKIAVAQIKIFDELSKNVNKVIEFIDRASIKKADLVCFPESCLGNDFLNVKNHPSIDGWHEAIASSSLVMTSGS
ncbi:hypothetical protein COV18_04790 [Candidatus Woesearchaeota archaeon CG10_big_fil_rev_8_21_14_0_10_37_12]|nr:MAG: hypothetical protein COV18_04790 [Candidatus Woesearchaeota archaeon CG10_big_fil_rev_8_21_14_0_10_37_12]